MEEPHLSIELEEEIVEEYNLRDASNILIGRIIFDKPVLKKRVINFVNTNWKTKKGFSISYWGKNTYAFQFQLVEDVDKILGMAPWFIRGNFLLLQEWELGKAADELNFNLCPFWVQIHGLPRSYFTEKNAKTIGSSLGTLVSFQGLGVATPVLSYLRLRVVIDISKPLITCFNVKGKDGNMNKQASIKYEKIDKIFCFGCGKSENFMIDCIDATKDLITGPFGPTMIMQGKQTYDDSFSDKDERETPELEKIRGSLQNVSLVKKLVVEDDEKDDDDEDSDDEEDDEDRLDSDDEDDDDADDDEDRLDSDDEDDDDDDNEESNDDKDEEDEPFVWVNSEDQNDKGILSSQEVYKNPTSDTYVMIGEAKTENLSSQLQSQAAEHFGAPNLEKVVSIPAEEDDDVDETGLVPKDIDLVMIQASVSRSRAVKALKAADGDIVTAIMELTNYEYLLNFLFL